MDTIEKNERYHKYGSKLLGSMQKQLNSASNRFYRKHQAKDGEEAEKHLTRTTESYQVPIHSMIQNPIAMAVLFLLAVETIAIIIMESFIIYYHTSIFIQCDFTLQTLGLGQLDLIYHAIFITVPIYQIFLYLDSLRQRNTVSLLTLLLFGILMVIFTGIQTIQHITFEQVGCNFPIGDNLNIMNNTTNNTIDLSNSIHMSVIIYNRSDDTLFQDILDNTISNMKPFEYAILALVPLCFILMTCGMIKLYHLFKWNNYLGHTFKEHRLRNTLIAWAVLSGLLKIDLFFLFIFAVQLVPSKMVGYTLPSFEGPLVFFLTILIFLIAVYAARYENVWLLGLFSIGLVAFIGYLGYRLFVFGIPRILANDPYMVKYKIHIYVCVYIYLYTYITNYYYYYYYYC
ncbi:uncharacterized protein BX663DRAFT_511103 [Cokeromyces recurvatus]|uniref:uncharacterized protein n=1 Tax=Cokeromyces recurvatus TaxID=90255 RepID=UPI00221F5B2D|nr:uncharacterized protein BX663DRAFT_511103 [Cokeromyces recurvatus]KAI7902446.1 hypothetical protein BX663DRAFT_511103 [Cokeromyces recurvatus]